MIRSRHLAAAVVIASAGLAVAGCGSSTTTQGQPAPSQAQTTTTTAVSTAQSQRTLAHALHLTKCLTADQDYLKLAGDWGKLDTANIADPSNQERLSRVVADIATYKTDLVVLRPSATADQQAQLDQYGGALSQLASGAQAAAGGDYSTATSDFTGAGPQIAAMPKLVNTICGV